MRIDRFLHCIRLGSVIALPLRGQVRILRVLALPVRRGPASEARACYDELSEARKIDAEAAST